MYKYILTALGMVYMALLLLICAAYVISIYVEDFDLTYIIK